jgi:Saccharopine dehydrogenase NADP binding domain
VSLRSVVVLGGYGNFGRRVVAALADDREYRVLIAGRDLKKARAVADEIGLGTEPIAIDCRSSELATGISRLKADVVVHTAGPFQGQDYAVPRACIDAHAHYIDLADGRAYVCGIHALDDAATCNGVLAVSGASTLPALSSAVVDELSAHFASIDSIEHAITSGAKPPGRATMEGVLGYAGLPFTSWRDGAWVTTHGWQDIERRRYPEPVGTRWLASCDVPDLELFPLRYEPVRTVAFRAGVAAAASTLSIWGASWLVRGGLVKTLSSYVPTLHGTALAIERFGSKWSAMHVTLRGLDRESKPASRTWTLLAGSDHGPHIPCFPATALARKLLRDQVQERGAMPCMGLLTVDDILAVGAGLDLHTMQSAS